MARVSRWGQWWPFTLLCLPSAAPLPAMDDHQWTKSEGAGGLGPLTFFPAPPPSFSTDYLLLPPPHSALVGPAPQNVLARTATDDHCSLRYHPPTFFVVCLYVGSHPPCFYQSLFWHTTWPNNCSFLCFPRPWNSPALCPWCYCW